MDDIKRWKPLKRFKPLRAQRQVLGIIKPQKQSAKAKLKAQQRLAYKLRYCKSHGRKENDVWGAPCQSCSRYFPISVANFSHKVPAGRGGDVKGQVQATNGIYSCRPCHEFVERDAEARNELIGSPVSCEIGGLVQWTPTTYRRLRAYIERWMR